MGDRIITYHPCPRCGKQMETYDTSSSLIYIYIYISECNHCDYKDEREYFDIKEHEIALITPKQLEELKKKNPKIKKFREKLEKLEQK